jgi:membrane-associated phospholipid phosphatase
MRLLPFVFALSMTLGPAAATGDDSADPPDHDHHVGRDILAAGKHAGKGFLTQFTEFDSWVLIAGLADVTFLLTLNEVQMQRSIEEDAVLAGGVVTTLDITATILNFGPAPIAAYAIGRITADEKATHFGMELAATHAILLVETFCISMIPFHKRPIVESGKVEDKDRKKLDDVLRGQSSFPSGHMVGISALMFKGWEYYGWRVGAPATLAAFFMGWARIQQGEHYVTDVVGTVGLAGIASLAVSRTRDLWTRRALGQGDTAQLFFWPMLSADSARMSVVGQF